MQGYGITWSPVSRRAHLLQRTTLRAGCRLPMTADCRSPDAALMVTNLDEGGRCPASLSSHQNPTSKAPGAACPSHSGPFIEKAICRTQAARRATGHAGQLHLRWAVPKGGSNRSLRLRDRPDIASRWLTRLHYRGQAAHNAASTLPCAPSITRHRPDHEHVPSVECKKNPNPIRPHEIAVTTIARLL